MWQYQDQTIQPAAAATRQPNQPQVIYMNSEGNQGCPMWNSGIPPTPGGDRASSANYSMRPGTMPYGGGVQYATNMQYADPVFNASGSHATAYGNNGGATAMTPVASGAVSSSSRSLFDRLGGLYPISAVVDRFSDEILKDSKVGRDSPNPQLRDWSRNQSKERLPGLKVQRTLWVAAAAGKSFGLIVNRLLILFVSRRTCQFPIYCN